MRSSTGRSPRRTTSLPTRMRVTLRLVLASRIAASTSRSLRSRSESIQLPSITFSPCLRASAGICSEGADRAVGADGTGRAGKQLQVRVDLRGGRVLACDRVLVLLVRLECEPMDDARQGRFGCRAIGIAPCRHREHGEQDDDQETRQLFHAPPARRAAILGAVQYGVRAAGCRVLATTERTWRAPHQRGALPVQIGASGGLECPGDQNFQTRFNCRVSTDGVLVAFSKSIQRIR